MTLFPDFRTFIEIGPLSIKWYAVFILTGAIVAYLLSAKEIKKMGYGNNIVDDLFFGALIFGIIGSRLWYVLFYDLSYYLSDPITIFMTWNGGMAIQGGLILGALFAYVFLKRKHISFLRMADAVVPTILIAQAIGRWGNFMNQEAYGGIVSSEFYQYWPEFIRNTMFIGGEYRAPTFFYESILNVLGYILIVYGLKRFGDNKRGDYAYAYLMWYGIVRFWVEGMRTDSLMFMGLRMAQVTSVLFIIIGLLGKLGVYRKWIKKEKPAIIFDLDGTLLDTEPTIVYAAQHALNHFFPDLKLTKQQELAFIGPTLHQSLAVYLSPEQLEEGVELYRKYNKEAHLTHLKVMDHALEVVKQLHDEGYPLGIFSSKKKEMVAYGLELTKMDKYFDVIIGYDEVKKHKPDPEGMITTLNAMGCTRDNAIYVGDSHTDMQSAHAAGLYTIAYLFHPERSDEILATKPNNSISDLRDILLIIQGDHSWTHNMM